MLECLQGELGLLGATIDGYGCAGVSGRHPVVDELELIQTCQRC